MKEYKIVSAVNKGAFNTAIGTLSGNGWTPSGNIFVDGAGAIFQMWERSINYE